MGVEERRRGGVEEVREREEEEVREDVADDEEGVRRVERPCAEVLKDLVTRLVIWAASWSTLTLPSSIGAVDEGRDTGRLELRRNCAVVKASALAATA